MQEQLIRLLMSVVLLIIVFDGLMIMIRVKFRLHKWILKKLGQFVVWLAKLPFRGIKAGAKALWIKIKNRNRPGHPTGQGGGTP
ncbi:hypothetical protein KJ885_04985 [Patescibacteria group bacterium]|nr:hypothetical protein [Patescibacteria group bacterium]